MHCVFIHTPFLFNNLNQIRIQNKEFYLVVRIIILQVQMSFKSTLLGVMIPLKQVYHICDEHLLKPYFMVQCHLFTVPVVKLGRNFAQVILENLISFKSVEYFKQVKLDFSDSVEKHLGLWAILIREDIGRGVHGLNAAH